MAKAKWPREALVFRISSEAFAWPGMVVEAVGFSHCRYEDLAEEFDDIQFRFPDTGYEDGYSVTMLKPLTPAARAFLAAVREGG